MSVQPTPVVPSGPESLRLLSEQIEGALAEPWFSSDGKAALCGKLEVEFENLGEGRYGTYDPTRRDDVNYLHLSAYLTLDRADEGDSIRIPMDSCSVRTLVPVATLPIVLRNLLALVVERLVAAGFDPLVHDAGDPPDLATTFRTFTYLAPHWVA